MTPLHESIQALRLQIAQDEQRLRELEAESDVLTAELKAFKAAYDLTVQPKVDRLKVVQGAIDELREQLIFKKDYGGWQPPDGYRSVEEQYRRAWTKPDDDATPDPKTEPPIMPPPILDKSDLKRLYRDLARQYHPDHARDEDDRVFRNQIMAQINAAYAVEDVQALHTLANHQGAVEPDQPLQELELATLRQIQEELRNRIFQMKQQIHELKHCDLMRLKIETSLAKAHGKDLLQQMADDLEQEYRARLRELYDLRSSQDSG